MPNRGKTGFAASGFNNRISSTATRHYSDREVVYAQGDAANSIFRVQKGHVKLTMAAVGKKNAAIAILSKGECFGEGCMMGPTFRTTTATSIHRSTVDEVSKRSMARRLHDEPLLSKLFITYLLQRISRVEDDLIDQMVNTSERRLARLLLQLSEFGVESKLPKLMVDVDQGTLAQVVGTTRSRVSHFMNQFRKKGLIDYDGSVGSVHVNKALRTFLQSAKDPSD
jgi:CRP/FNR family transcriptional regulator, cyclic AMP receptor protein